MVRRKTVETIVAKLLTRMASLIKERRAYATVELVLLAAAFVSIGIIFNQQILNFVDHHMDQVLETSYDADHFPISD